MTLRFEIVEERGFSRWSLVYPRGRGKRPNVIAGGTAATRDECMARIEEFRKAIVDAKIVKVTS